MLLRDRLDMKERFDFDKADKITKWVVRLVLAPLAALYVVIMQREFKQHVAPRFHGKLFAYDVGPDRFGNPFHPELQSAIDSMIRQHGLFLKRKKVAPALT